MPPVGESKLEWFDTPIPNHDYYRRRGFDSGGCNYANREFLARIDVLGGGKAVAWTYDLESVGGGSLQRDVHSDDWCPAPRLPDNEVRNNCHIFRPQLGFPGPDGSDAKPAEDVLGGGRLPGPRWR